MQLLVLLLAIPFFKVSLCDFTLGGLGGTSLYIGDDSAVAIVPDFTALAGATQYSFECWVYSRSSTNQPSVISFANVDDTEYWNLAFGNLFFFTVHYNTDVFDNPFPLDTWHHVAITVDTQATAKGKDSVIVYVDGEMFQRRNWTIEGTFPASISLLMGKYYAVMNEASLDVDPTASFRGFRKMLLC